MDQLIDEAKVLNKFSMNAKHDAVSHRPATLQVEFIRQTSPPINITLEVQYLPAIYSPLFKKIQQLCSIIFTSNNEIYSWGSATEELEKLIPFHLFSKTIQITDQNIQDTYDPVQKRSLQSAVKTEIEEYLHITATSAEWDFRIDLVLGTYILTQVTCRERAYRMEEEKKYRSILKEYAINDVFAVTKLSYKMNLMLSTTTIEHEAIIHDYVREQNYEEPSIELKLLDEGLILDDEAERFLTRKQIKNRKTNRHRFEVIQHACRLFNITKIKRILKSNNNCGIEFSPNNIIIDYMVNESQGMIFCLFCFFLPCFLSLASGVITFSCVKCLLTTLFFLKDISFFPLFSHVCGHTSHCGKSTVKGVAFTSSSLFDSDIYIYIYIYVCVCVGFLFLFRIKMIHHRRFHL